MDNTEEKIKN
jgi:hypothetical protein